MFIFNGIWLERTKHPLDWSSFTWVAEPKGKNVEQDFFFGCNIDSGSSHQSVRESEGLQ